MNIFVTVGTTPFDTLVQAIDQGPHAKDCSIQIGGGSYEPQQADWFRFKSSIQDDIRKADIVVCHAGAGTVFQLLQDQQIPLVVPNTERRDQHQQELARWLHRKHYAAVAFTTDEVNQVLNEYASIRENCVPFDEVRFFYQNELDAIARRSLFGKHKTQNP